MPDQFATPEPDEAIKLAMRRVRETTAAGEGSDMEGLEFNEVIVNMGPQHPSTHGVLRLVVTLDGELVKDVIPVIGYLHRCKEKLAEKRTYFQYIPIIDRTEYVRQHELRVGATSSRSRSSWASGRRGGRSSSASSPAS